MTDEDAEPCAPWLACIPLAPSYRSLAFAIVQHGRAVVPPEGLSEVLRFHADGQGGWISAARAASGRWGYIDAHGRWRVSPTLQHARSFSPDGLARFCDAGRWGFVNLAGEVVIPPAFEDAHPFRNGVCGVRVAPHAWRVIDARGQWVNAEQYRELGAFAANGLSRAAKLGAEEGPRALGFVDRHGRWVIKPRLACAHPFGESAVTPASADGKAWGLIDAAGRWVLAPQHARIDPFNSDGLAFFVAASDAARGYLDTQGRVALRGGPELSARMACGVVAQGRGAPCYLTAEGHAVVTPALSFGGDFSAERCFAVVRTASSHGGAQPGAHAEPARWGLLHPDGRLVPAPAHLLEPLTDGEGWLAQALPDTPHVPFITRDGQLAGIDGEGEVVWRAHYDGQQVALLDAQGTALWRSGIRENCWPPRPFFLVRPADHLEAVDNPDAVAALATRLLGEAATGAAVLQRRLLRTHLSDAHRQAYGFLTEALRESVHTLHGGMARRLSQRLGAPQALPDPQHLHPEPLVHAGAAEPALVWPASPGPGGGQLLLGLREGATPDGQWWEVWLLAAAHHSALADAWHALQAQSPQPPPAAQPPRPSGAAPAPQGRRPQRAALAGGSHDANAWAPRSSVMGPATAQAAGFEPAPRRALRPQRAGPVAPRRGQWLLGAAAGVGHLALSAAAWGREGPAAALGTFALAGVSEIYWAWRFMTDTPASPWLALLCAAIAVAGAQAARGTLRRGRSVPQQGWR